MTNLIAAAIAEAEVITASAPPDASRNKPRLLVESSDPDRTVAALRNILADAGLLFDRGVPVRLTFDQIQGGAAAQIMSPDGLVLMAHNVCRPYALKQQKDGTIKAINVRLPRCLPSCISTGAANGGFRFSTGSRPRRCFARTAPFSAPKDTMRRPACGSRMCRISQMLSPTTRHEGKLKPGSTSFARRSRPSASRMPRVTSIPRRA